LGAAFDAVFGVAFDAVLGFALGTAFAAGSGFGALALAATVPVAGVARLLGEAFVLLFTVAICTSSGVSEYRDSMLR
jgi:hypothetical protein